MDSEVLELMGTGIKELSANGMRAYSAVMMQVSVQFDEDKAFVKLTLNSRQRRAVPFLNTAKAQGDLVVIRLERVMTVVDVVWNDNIVSNAQKLYGITDLSYVADGLVTI